MSQDKEFQPKTVIWREVDYAHHLGQVLGVLDYDQNFDNGFQKWKLAMSFVDDVKVNISNGVIPLEEKGMMDELYPDTNAMFKMDTIWHGNTFLGIVKNQDRTNVVRKELFYKRPEDYFEVELDGEIHEFPREIIPLPKLKNLVPVRQIKDETWGIQVREPMEWRHATEGSQYGTIINDGNFQWQTSQGLIPKIEPDDMEGYGKLTYIYSRPVYFELMDILGTWFDKNYQIFAGDVHKIMVWMNNLKLQDEDFDDDNNTQQSTSKFRKDVM